MQPVITDFIEIRIDLTNVKISTLYGPNKQLNI